jgi:hypothetical protein
MAVLSLFGNSPNNGIDGSSCFGTGSFHDTSNGITLLVVTHIRRASTSQNAVWREAENKKGSDGATHSCLS